MKTARFLNGNIDPEKHTPLRISAGNPRYPLPYAIRDKAAILAPPYRILKIADQEEYRRLYFEQLDKYGVQKIYSVLKSLAEPGKEIVLLCFEDICKPGQWCHRRMFAEWWEAKTGKAVEELEEAQPLPPGKAKRSGSTRPLF